jgi:hypothetical protein
VTQNFCYAIHATAPDLILKGTEGGDSCGHGPRGFGKVFGPLKYGADTVVKVASGADRQFDLIGFMVPLGTPTDCSGELKFVTQKSSNETKNEVRVSVFYAGVEIDPENDGSAASNDPNRRIYLFARSKSDTLKPGSQSVLLNPIAWQERAEAGTTKLYPTRYKCPDSSAQVELETNAHDFGMVFSRAVKPIKITNNGSTAVTFEEVGIWQNDALVPASYPLNFASYYASSVFPGWGGTCGMSLAAGSECVFNVQLDPAKIPAAQLLQIFSAQVRMTWKAAGDVSSKTSFVNLSGGAGYVPGYQYSRGSGSPAPTNGDTTFASGEYVSFFLTNGASSNLQVSSIQTPPGFHSVTPFYDTNGVNTTCPFTGYARCEDSPTIGINPSACIICLKYDGSDVPRGELRVHFLNGSSYGTWVAPTSP